MLKGFPTSNRINASKFAETTSVSHNNNTMALVGFASKGPINIPVAIKDNRQLRKTFGPPHPDQKESNLLYAAEQCLLVGAELLICRAGNDSAKTASIAIPGADNLVKTHSNWPEPYIFHTNQFFRWKLDRKLSGKTLVVLATEEQGISAAQLADELNDQLSPKDGIDFYVYKEKYLGVRTTLTSKNELELISIQDAMYGPWGVTGLGPQMGPAEKIGIPQEEYNFEFEENLIIELVVSGSTNPTIDNIVQIVKLKGLEGKKNSIGDIVDYINNIELPLLPGGWRAFASGNALGIRTKHVGRDATLIVKFNNASKIFGFDSMPAIGKSPKDEAIFFGSKNSDGLPSLTIYADSPGTEGNNTKVIITNDKESDVFTIDVFSNGVQVESWGQLTKNQDSRLYVESFINLFSEWIKIKDNTENINPPKNGTYLLGDEKSAASTKGCDGIPENLAHQDDLLTNTLQSLANTEIDMIAIPGHSSEKVIDALLEFCNKKCMAIIDPPIEFSFKETTNWAKKFKSDYGAIFWPWVQVRDAYNRRNVWIPPSGSVMATIAKSDALSGPFYAATAGIVPGIMNVFKHPSNKEISSDSSINQILHRKNNDSFIVNSQKTLFNGEVNTTRILFFIGKKIRSYIHKLTIGYELSQDKFQDIIHEVCKRVLEETKNNRGIHDYEIFYEKINATGIDKKEEIKAKIGIKPREASKVYNLDLVFIP